MATTWWSDDSDDDDDEYIMNEVAPPTIDDKFRKDVLSIKHIIYDNTVLSPELGTDDAQNNKILGSYLKNMNEVYILCVNAQRGKIDYNKLNKLPNNVQDLLKKLLLWISDYFRKNTIPDTIPYEDYINKTFKEYQFIQHNSFE